MQKSKFQPIRSCHSARGGARGLNFLYRGYAMGISSRGKFQPPGCFPWHSTKGPKPKVGIQNFGTIFLPKNSKSEKIKYEVKLGAGDMKMHKFSDFENMGSLSLNGRQKGGGWCCDFSFGVAILC